MEEALAQVRLQAAERGKPLSEEASSAAAEALVQRHRKKVTRRFLHEIAKTEPKLYQVEVALGKRDAKSAPKSDWVQRLVAKKSALQSRIGEVQRALEDWKSGFS